MCQSSGIDEAQVTKESVLGIQQTPGEPTVPPDEGKTELHLAAETGNTQLVESLLESGVDLCEKSKIGWTALHYATKSGDLQTVQLLALREDKKILNTLTTAFSSALHIAARHADKEFCSFLIECGIDAKAVNKFGRTALHNACHAGNLEVVSFFADLKDFNFNKKSGDKMSLLHLAAISGRLELLEFLIGKSFDCNDEDEAGCTPLLVAARNSSVEIVKFLVEHGSDLQAEDKLAYDAFFLACYGGKLESAKYLLSVGTFDVNKRNKLNLTPLLVATMNDQVKIMEFLLEVGADLEARGGVHDTTPYLIAASYSTVETINFLVEKGANMDVLDNMDACAFQRACDVDDLDMLMYLVSIGQYDLKRRNINGKTAWVKASRNESKEVKQYLIGLGANIHDTDNFNLGGMVLAAQFSTPPNCQFMLDIGLGFDVLTKEGGNALHQACVSGNLSTAKFILERKYLDVNTPMPNGRTALHIASGRESLDMVKLLLEHGADVRLRTKNGQLAIHSAAMRGSFEIIEFFVKEFRYMLEEKTKRNETPVLLACGNHNTNVFQHLVNADINLQAADNFGKNALLCASIAGNLEVVTFLIENEFDTSVQTRYGENALHLAAKGGHCNVVKYLVDDLKMDVNQRAYNGSTPLLLAAEFGNKETCQWLIDQGANLQAENRNGNNALICACISLIPSIARVELLLETGKVQVSKKNKFGHTALHLAVEKGSIELVKYLVETAHADLEREDYDGWTVLHVAAKFAPLKVNEYLVQKQESLLNRRNGRHQLPRDLARENDNVEVLLFYDSFKSEMPSVEDAPQNRGWRNQNTRDNLFTPQNRAYGNPLFNSNWRS